MARYRFVFAAAYVEDLRAQPAFDRAAIQSAIIAKLADTPEEPSKNRRRLTEPISWCAEVGWQLRVGDYRVLYRVVGGTVEVLRVRFKGRLPTEGMGP